MSKEYTTLEKVIPYLMYGKNREVELFELQAIAVEKLNRNKYTMVFDETGAGKTITAGNCILDTVIKKKNKCTNLLILCPQTLTANWHNKILEKYGIEFKIWGGKSTDLKYFNENESNFIITSYSGNEEKESSNKGLDVLVEKLRDIDFKWDLIILDESHNTKASTTHASIKKLRAFKTILLSATPITNRIEELQKQIDLINSMLSREKENLIKLSDIISDPLEMVEKLSVNTPVMRNFKEIISGKEPKKRRIIPLKYNVDEKDAINFFRKHQYHDFSYFQNCCNIKLVLGENMAIDNKLEIFLDKIKELSESEKSKAIVFCKRKDTVEYLRYSLINRFPELKVKAITSEAFSSIDERKKFISLSNKERSDYSKIKVLITIDTLLSEGYDMVSFDTVFNYELPFTPAQMEQRLGRIDRIVGSNHDEITMYNFENLNYIEEFDCAYKSILKFKNETQVLTCIPSKSMMNINEIKNILITNMIKYLGFVFLKETVYVELNFNENIMQIEKNASEIASKILKILLIDKTEDISNTVMRILRLSMETKYSFVEQIQPNKLINLDEFISNSKLQLENLCGVKDINFDNIGTVFQNKLSELKKSLISYEMSNNIVWIDPKIGLTFKSIDEIKENINRSIKSYYENKPLKSHIHIGDLTIEEIENALIEMDQQMGSVEFSEETIRKVIRIIGEYNYVLKSSVVYTMWKRYFSKKINYKNYIEMINEVICNEP